MWFSLDTLRDHCPFLMLEMHESVIGKARSDEIVQLLENAGFRIVANIDRNRVFQRA